MNNLTQKKLCRGDGIWLCENVGGKIHFTIPSFFILFMDHTFCGCCLLAYKKTNYCDIGLNYNLRMIKLIFESHDYFDQPFNSSIEMYIDHLIFNES